MICERSFCKHGRKRSVPLREQSGLGIFCAHSRFIMRGQTVYAVVSFNFSLHDYFLYFVCPSNRPSLTPKLLSWQTIIGDSRTGQEPSTTGVCNVPSCWGPDFTPK